MHMVLWFAQQNFTHLAIFTDPRAFFPGLGDLVSSISLFVLLVSLP